MGFKFLLMWILVFTFAYQVHAEGSKSKAESKYAYKIFNFESELGREVDNVEYEALVNFWNQADALKSQWATQVASTDDTNENVSVLFCLSIKGALFKKLGAGLCTSASGGIYVIDLPGSGLSVGIAGSGTVLVYKGSGSIKGRYRGIAVGLSGVNVAKRGAKKLLKHLGVEASHAKKVGGDGTLIVAGLQIGPMLDFSNVEITIE